MKSVQPGTRMYVGHYRQAGVAMVNRPHAISTARSSLYRTLFRKRAFSAITDCLRIVQERNSHS